jgi:hypothetical protein
MYLTNEQKDEFLKGTLTPNNVVEIIGNDALGWAELLEYIYKSHSNLSAEKKFADTKRSELIMNISSAKEWFDRLVEDASADESDLVELAEIFGWETSKDVDVILTITASGTVSVPLGKNVADVYEDIEVDVSLSSWSDFQIDVSADDIEISEN